MTNNVETDHTVKRSQPNSILCAFNSMRYLCVVGSRSFGLLILLNFCCLCQAGCCIFGKKETCGRSKITSATIRTQREYNLWYSHCSVDIISFNSVDKRNCWWMRIVWCCACCTSMEILWVFVATANRKCTAFIVCCNRGFCNIFHSFDLNECYLTLPNSYYGNGTTTWCCNFLANKAINAIYQILSDKSKTSQKKKNIFVI